jgi:protocatechuate 3,4-dioxygenase beta subunit
MLRGARIGPGVLVCLLGAIPCVAGSIEVTVEERDGGPVREQWIALENTAADFLHRTRRGRTDADGKATFAALPAGTYTISVGRLRGRDLVPPHENPFAPRPVVTLATGDEDLQIVVELWRGVRVVSQLIVDRRESRPSLVRYESLDSDLRLESRFDPAGYAERVLVPGRWRVSIEPPPGFLLTDFEIDGRSHDDHEAVLDLGRYPNTTHLTWRYSGPALIYGRVAREGEGEMTVVATLVEPGTWIEAANYRGGSDVEHVEARWPDPNNYEIVLPDGRWSVRPVGNGVVWSEPEQELVNVAAGEERRVDFTVGLEASESTELLVSVLVSTGRWAPIEKARIEVWSLDDDSRPASKVGQGETESWYLPARISGIPAGNHVVVAGHRDYLEGRETIEYEPDPVKPPSVSVRLPSGAAILAGALDEDDEPVPDVEVEIVRLDELPEITIEDEGFRNDKSRRVGATDATGHIKLEGLYPGRYALRGRLRGALAATRFVRVIDDGEQHDEIELELGNEKERHIDLAVRPAASLSGTLACTDGGSLPGATSIRALLPEVDELDRREDPDLTLDALLALDDQPLTGKHLDRFLAGPLEETRLQLALRPSGYGTWTWALSTEQREHAAVISTSLGETDDLGTIRIECGPAAEAVPTVTDGSPLPDLRDVDVHATATALRGNPNRDSVRPRVESLPGSVLLRDLPEGEIELEVVLSHPHFLPTEEQLWIFEREVQRGWLIAIQPEVPSIGGAILMVGLEGALVRLGGLDGLLRTVEVEDGRAWFVSLPAGPYRAELCADTACADVRRVWETAVVKTGHTLTLD